MALQFALFLMGKSINPILQEHRIEFMCEVLFVISRRMRILLTISTPSYLLLMYFVNVKNVFLLPEADNQLVLTMHVVLFLINAIALFLVTFRRAKIASNITTHHFFAIVAVYIAWIGATLFFMITVVKTNGHPIFVFLAVLTWSSSFLFPPRVLIFTHCIFLTSAGIILAMFHLPTDNPRFTGEAIAASLGISAVLVASGTEMFKTQTEEFRQRKMIEHERNIISALNLELERRQDVLEHQATEIEIINTQLQEQNQTLWELNNEKNEIMGIVAHDLKNPIGAVRNFAELIQEGYVPAEETSEIAEKITTVSNRMLELVTNLLDVNRLESGAMEISAIEFDIVPLVASIVESYQTQAAAKNIALYFRKETTETCVTADEQAVMQVLDNLISNAVKYSPHHKSIFVSLHSSKDKVRVEVKDEGPGLSPDDMKRLFGKFARLSARPTGGEHSTGLGLSIVKKMVEAMNGRVWCEAEVGKGATFIVELPLG